MEDLYPVILLRSSRSSLRYGYYWCAFEHFFTVFQLYGPLNMLGSIYRSINTSLVDTEKLLKLLNETTDINDKPNAPDLIVTDGEIEFGD
jgi:ABC-type multidrug transport system fused ATPase/permease subunit